MKLAVCVCVDVLMSLQCEINIVFVLIMDDWCEIRWNVFCMLSHVTAMTVKRVTDSFAVQCLL